MALCNGQPVVEVAQQGPQGAQGPAGVQGNPGAAGRTVLNGTVVPPNALGVDGDFYLRTNTSELYGPRVAGVWPLPPVSLIGPVGPAGPPGIGAGTALTNEPQTPVNGQTVFTLNFQPISAEAIWIVSNRLVLHPIVDFAASGPTLQTITIPSFPVKASDVMTIYYQKA